MQTEYTVFSNHHEALITVCLYQSQDLQVVSYAFTSFGKTAIKKKKLHPDTFVQLALQLAYYKLHGK